MYSESLGAGKISYSSRADQEICESLAAWEKFLIIRFDRIYIHHISYFRRKPLSQMCKRIPPINCHKVI